MQLLEISETKKDAFDPPAPQPPARAPAHPLPAHQPPSSFPHATQDVAVLRTEPPRRPACPQRHFNPNLSLCPSQRKLSIPRRNSLANFRWAPPIDVLQRTHRWHTGSKSHSRPQVAHRQQIPFPSNQERSTLLLSLRLRAGRDAVRFRH